MKDNFLLKKNQSKVFNELSNEDAGKLIKGILNYANTGDSQLDGYLKIIFLPIKDDIDKNEEKYKKRCEINRTNGSRGGAPKGNKNAKKTKTTENNQSVRKTTENNMNNHNHIHIHNSYSNNNLEEIGYGEEKPLLVADDTGLLAETTKKAIDYLNEIANTNFRTSSKMTKGKIQARLNEGYRLNDFTVVIEKKAKEWIGTEFEKYLCPETLFGNKFEKYLNQKVVEPKAKETKRDKTMDVLRGVYDGSIKIN